MKENLSDIELIELIKNVFPNYELQDKIAILIDFPHTEDKDNKDWIERREIAKEWINILKDNIAKLNLSEISLIGYPAVSANNGDLPEYCFDITNSQLPKTAEELIKNRKISFDNLFDNYKIFIAMTQLSATAPLKNNAKKYNFRAATMPGFSKEMIPALRINYEKVAKNVKLIKEKLDKAEYAEVIFNTKDKEEIKTIFDLRFRKAHESSGRFPKIGTAGNLPSGEAYIVPYEGEFEEESKTNGIIPVQINNDIVYYRVKNNRVIEVKGEGKEVEKEAEHLKREPAYGNIAELGFGVLYDFGLKPIGEILLDEKLGFHIAFGRSDHFGGQIGPKDFTSPEEVIHLDRIYIKEIQPFVIIKELTLVYNDSKEIIIKNNKILTSDN
jgi:hypothetical protein